MIQFAGTIAALLLAVSPAFAAEPATSGVNLGNVKGGDFTRAHSIIDKSCTSCHSRVKIDEAMKSGRDMTAIQKEMEKRGARLNENERDVLGIFWKESPLKKSSK